MLRSSLHLDSNTSELLIRKLLEFLSFVHTIHFWFVWTVDGQTFLENTKLGQQYILDSMDWIDQLLGAFLQQSHRQHKKTGIGCHILFVDAKF